MKRRGLLGAFGALMAAPVIIRTPGLLMPVREWGVPLVELRVFSVDPFGREVVVRRHKTNQVLPLPGDMSGDPAWAHVLGKAEIRMAYGELAALRPTRVEATAHHPKYGIRRSHIEPAEFRGANEATRHVFEWGIRA